MEIFVISRQRMIKFMGSKEFDLTAMNFISIGDPDMDFLFPEDCPTNVLQLKFNDLEAEDWESESDKAFMEKKGWVLFNESHARKIIEFMDKMDKSKNLIVHCVAGICRSGAVGDFARSKFGIPFEEFMRKNRQIAPNSHVFRTLRDVQEKILY